jgi:hypothetical protein
MNDRLKSGRSILVRRYPVSFLSDVIYGVQPMTTELAESIRTLRRDHHFTYQHVGYYLAETDPDSGAPYGIGQALTKLAARHLKDDDPSWV